MEWVFLVVFLVVYFLPSFVASDGRHPSAGGVFVLNLFLGWTLVGWVVALAWASSRPAPVTVIERPAAASEPRWAKQGSSLSGEIQQLATLKERGVLSEAEFETAKARLLAESR